MIQPLFPNDDDNQSAAQHDENYLLHHGHGRKVHPVSKELTHPHTAPDTPAVELIRSKLNAIYQQEPSATQELEQAAAPVPARSKHQQFMYDLSTSGKSLAQIQTLWHNYYVALPDNEKHQVWHEFYAANTSRPSAYTQYVASQSSHASAVQPQLPSLPSAARASSKHEAHHTAVVAEHSMPHYRKEKRSQAKIKKAIITKVRSRTSEKTRARAKRHFHSLMFGLASGAVVMALFFFGLFNEMIIAPFIQPSRQVSATPIIVDSESVAPSETPEVIIPKINVQLPVVYDEPSMEEHAIQTALERGVVHYPTTVLPGQQGNAAIFGHSSNNIFNKGKYKFAFAMLRHLEPGDIFYLTYDKKIYSYRIFAKRVVTPQEVSVLGPVEGKAVTAALITCDPPGTSTNRLVVWGEQISPDPAVATAPITPPASGGSSQPETLAGEGPRLWDRIWNAIF
jgi:LPXTG-site transpeptidase (sortase) family protein